MNNLVKQLTKIITIVLITILLVTNPGSHKYETYASKQLTSYLKEDLCLQITEETGEKLTTPCYLLVDVARPQIEATLNKNTKQQNFFLFSIYRTKFSLPPIVEEHHFATLGILDRFFTYETETKE